jgi:hypothetical protein
MVAGLAAVGAGLWLLSRRRARDPLVPARPRDAGWRWALAGIGLGGTSLTMMYGQQMYNLGGWHWMDDEVAVVPYLLDEVFWAAPASGALGWLAFVAGVAATVVGSCLAAVSVRPLVDRASPRVRKVGWQAGAVLLVLGGGLAAAHAWSEWRHWSTLTSMDEPTTGLLKHTHAVWEGTIGVVTPTQHLVTAAVVGLLLLLLHVLRTRPARA